MSPKPPAAQQGEPSRVAFMILVVAAAASVAVGASLTSAVDVVRDRPLSVATFLALSLVFQLLSVEVYGKGTLGVGAIAILAAGFTLGPGAAMLIAVTTAVFHAVRRQALGTKAAFDAANLALAAGGAALVYLPFADYGSPLARLAAATLAGAVYSGLNTGLLSVVMAASESAPVRTVWRERFHWARFHFLGYGPLGLALIVAHERMGFIGIVAFALPPVLTAISVRQYLEHTRRAVSEVREANHELRRAHRDTIAALSRTIEAKDRYTSGHTERVAGIAVALARRLGFRGENLEAVEIGALLHDVGKIGIPEQILNKAGPLDDAEWEVMRQHPVVSDFILAETALHPSVRQIARSSHERIDGTGYPDRLEGEAIPLAARIVFVADAFDALTSERPYRPAQTVQAAIDEVRRNAGTQFCPRVVAALERIRREEPHLLGNDPVARADAA